MRTLVSLLIFAGLAGAQSFNAIRIIPKADDTAVGEIRFAEKRVNGENYIGLKAPVSVAADKVFVLPATDGTPSQCVKTDGSGNLGFADCLGSGGLPVVDTTAIVKGSVDATKQIRFEVDGLTTGVTRVLTPPDLDISIVGAENNETISGRKKFSNYVDFARTGSTSYWTVDVYSDAVNNSHFSILDHAGATAFELYKVGPVSNVSYLHLNFLPGTGNTYDVGASASRWKKLWVQDVDVSGTCTGCGGAGTLPVTDDTAIVKGLADNTKRMRFDVSGVTTGMTRVLAVPNADVTLAGLNIAQTFTADQGFNANVLLYNNKAVYIADSGGTSRMAMKRGTDNVLHVGVIEAPATGAYLGLWSNGTQVANLIKAPAGSSTLQPLLDMNMYLGDSTYRLAGISAYGATFYSGGGVEANASLQAATGGGWLGLRAASSSASSWTLRFPPAQPGATKFLRTSSVGADVQLEWADGGGVTGVTANLPIISSGGVSPNITCPTCVTTDTTQTITGTKTFNANITMGGALGGHIYANNDNLWWIGTQAQRFARVYAASVFSASVNAEQIDPFAYGGNHLLTINGHLSPLTSGVYDLGYGAFGIKWRDLYLTGTAFAPFGVESKTGGHGATGFNYWNGLSYENGTSATLWCAGGEAIKGITVRGGVVTAVQCAAP